MEVDLLEVYPQPPEEQFDDVAALLSPITLHDPQTLQGLGEEPVERIE